MLKNKKWLIIIAVAVIISIIIITNKQNTPLPGYDGTTDVIPVPEETTEYVESFVHTDKKTGLSLMVPEGWQYVLKSGFDTYVHSPSATAVQIQSLDYDPYINTVSYDYFSAEKKEAGGDLIDFQWTSNSSYTLSYVLPENERYIDYVEYVTFDRDNIVRVLYTVNDEYYLQMKNEIAYSMDSIVWNKQNPVPETVHLAYSDYGNFEYACPIGWEDGINDGVYYAMDPVSKAAYAVQVSESSNLYNNISQLDYVNYASKGRTNFSLDSFYNDTYVINATANYYANDTRMMMRQYLIATGEYEYTLTEECPVDSYQTCSQVFDDIFSVFRSFAPLRNPVEEPAAS